MATTNVTGTLTGSLTTEGREWDFTIKCYGTAYYSPEKRVPGNETMIESFEESGIELDDWEPAEILIDGKPHELLQYDVLDEYVVEHQCEINWEEPDYE